MFEISGTDITRLSDTDLRCLVRRLATAELRAQGCPVSSITAGGDQDAPDGGIDVRVECPIPLTTPDFVPRQHTGYQVKKSDMPASAIQAEMRPGNVLRPAIRNLATASGAYVIVSAQGSAADAALSARREAMRDAISELSTATQLHTDFYDRDRLAIWINEYPGIAAWVRTRVGRPLSGWSGIGDWERVGGNSSSPYLINDNACLIDERSRQRKPLNITDGISHLREALRKPGQCIRLIGLSGLGKTRLVQALFKEGVGEDPLDASLAIYTDYSESTVPTARDMARDLLASGRHAILVVDNCNPATHSELARLCSRDNSMVSLISIEYDVRDDEPEHTDVFRLQPASPDLVTEWLKCNFPQVSQIDREKIAEFSAGNFRIARALAETLGKGETLGSLKSRELFNRIFQQRNEPDQQLLRAAEDLALFYSIDGEDVSTAGELAHVATIRRIETINLFEALIELRRRGVVQARGRFRAILPQAIANPLAAYAIERIPPAEFDRFCTTLPPRLLKSISRRLGFLHDSSAAEAAVARWLRSNGPFGDLFAISDHGFQIVTNIAPVAPEAVLTKLEQSLVSSADTSTNLKNHYQWIRLIKAIGYDDHLFERTILLLARLLAAEPEGNSNNSASEPIKEFFHLYLSGTKAPPELRRAAIRRFALSRDTALKRCASIALDALLESQHFMSFGHSDFGARSRDWGWSPKFNRDIWDWYSEAIALAVELVPHLADARTILANNVRALWKIEPCQESLERAANTLIKERPWIEGWIAFRAARRYDGKEMSEDASARLAKIIQLLKPSDLLNHTRAVVLNRAGGWDIADGEDDDGNAIKSWEKADKMAREAGRLHAHDDSVRAAFLAELLVASQADRAYEFGRGLCDGANDLGLMWSELEAAYYSADPKIRNAAVLGGFLYEMHQRDRIFATSTLEAVMDKPFLAPLLPYLQARAGIDEEGIARLRRAIAKGVLVSGDFYAIANGAVLNSPPEPLGALLEDIANLSGGIDIALDILSMYFHGDSKSAQSRNPRLLEVGRSLLLRANFSGRNSVRDYRTGIVISICLSGEHVKDVAERLCANIRSAHDGTYFPPRELNHTLQSLFESQPFVALNSFLLPSHSNERGELFDSIFTEKIPIHIINPAILESWADQDPAIRYPLLGKCVPMIGKENEEHEKELAPLFLALLDRAPDKRLFLGDIWNRVHPRSWTGSLADILIGRKALIMKLAEHFDEQVRAWTIESLATLDKWIEEERGRERRNEESFE